MCFARKCSGCVVFSDEDVRCLFPGAPFWFTFLASLLGIPFWITLRPPISGIHFPSCFTFQSVHFRILLDFSGSISQQPYLLGVPFRCPFLTFLLCVHFRRPHLVFLPRVRFRRILPVPCHYSWAICLHALLPAVATTAPPRMRYRRQHIAKHVKSLSPV
jgi:hypothetical protein